MRHGSVVPQLHEYSSTSRVNGVSDRLPSSALFLAIDARSAVPPLCVFADPGALADDEAGRGALFVVFPHQVRWHVARIISACSRQRSHHHSIAELEVSEFV